MQNLIKAINSYVPLSEEDIHIIGQLFTERTIKAHDFLLEAGKVCREFVFIKAGLLRHYINNDGKEETIYFSAENDFVCDYESFVNKTISRKVIVALEDTTIFSISYDHIQQFYRKVSSGERFGRLFLEETFTRVIRFIISSHTDSAEQRYVNFLSSYKHIQQRIPQYYIASFVGVTPQSLSRIRRNLVRR